jgi:hypothetical protein
VRNPTTWFQLGLIGDALKARLRPGFFYAVSVNGSVAPSGLGHGARTATRAARVRYLGMHYLSASGATLNIETRRVPLITFAVTNALRYYAS